MFVDSAVFEAEEKEAYFSIDERKIREFNRKYDLPNYEEPDRFWSIVYFYIFDHPDCSDDLREKAFNWLIDKGIIKKKQSLSAKYDRYQLEHMLLPECFYKYGKQFMDDIMLGGSLYACKLYKDVAGGPYTPVQFRVRPIKPEDPYVIRVDLPTPADCLRCRRIYLALSKNKSKMMYFTSELTYDGGYILCGWTEDQTHLNFGRPEDEQAFVVKYFDE